MSVIAGINGAVDTISTVRRWNITSSAELQAIIASNTKGGRIRLAGNKDWSGSYSAYGDTPVKMPGDGFTFTGKFETDTLVNGVQGAAIVDQVVITVDIEAGLPISHEVSFSSNGALSFANDLTDFSDTTDPEPPSAIGTKIEIGTVASTPSFTEVVNFRTATLTLTRDNQSYVSSGTAGETKRLMGNFDAQLSFSVYEGDATVLIPVNTIKQVRLYVNGSEFYDLKWMRFGEASDIDVDTETGALIGATMNCSMHGFTEVPAGSDVVTGYIKDPGAVTIWPA